MLFAHGVASGAHIKQHTAILQQRSCGVVSEICFNLPGQQLR